MPKNGNCTRCALHQGVQTRCVWGEGKRGGVLLLGEGPGSEEDKAGRVFVGAAGKELSELLAAAGHSREDVYIANVVKCRPPGNRAPLVGEVNACFPYLAEEMADVQPKVILCLGGSALKALTGKDGVNAHRGKPVAVKPQVRLGDTQVYVTYHPAATMHNRNKVEQKRIKDAIVQDLRLAFSIAEGAREAKDHLKALLPDGYTASTLTKCLDRLSDCKVLACDLEWTALKDRNMSWPWTRGAELYTISLTGKVGTQYLSLAFSWPPPPDAMQPLKEFFANKPMVFHNALADLNWLEHVGLAVKLAGDTLVLAHLLDEEQRLSLEQLAPLYTDIEPGWKVGPWDKRPVSREAWLEILTYNADDTYATIKLAEALHERLESLDERERDGIKRMYYKLLLPVIPTMVSMALVGIPMDSDLTAREYDNSQQRAKDLSLQIANIVGCNPIQALQLATSPMQTLNYLKEAYNLDIDHSSKDDLSAFENDFPIINLIQKVRWERNKVQGTYLGPWYELLQEQGDGRLHSVYRLTYARTGRTSAEIEKGGSLQLMPRNSADRDLKCRHLVKAKSGRMILAADYSQIEMRIAAWFANERRMQQFFQDGTDLHTMTAAYVKASKDYHVPIQEFLLHPDEWVAGVTKDERQAAKPVNFGFLYGQQVEGFIAYAKSNYQIDFTYDEGEVIRSSYFQLYPDLVTWHNYCKNVILPRGYTETPFGRFRRVIEDANKAINTPVQSTASDLTLYALMNVDREFKRRQWPAWVIGFVHDSVLVEAELDYVDRAREVIQYEMENPNLLPLGVKSLPIPLKADVEVGPSWGEAR